MLFPIFCCLLTLSVSAFFHNFQITNFGLMWYRKNLMWCRNCNFRFRIREMKSSHSNAFATIPIPKCCWPIYLCKRRLQHPDPLTYLYRSLSYRGCQVSNHSVTCKLIPMPVLHIRSRTMKRVCLYITDNKAFSLFFTQNIAWRADYTSNVCKCAYH